MSGREIDANRDAPAVSSLDARVYTYMRMAILRAFSGFSPSALFVMFLEEDFIRNYWVKAFGVLLCLVAMGRATLIGR